MFGMELKLEGSAASQAELRRALTLENAAKTVHRVQCFDTPDKRLADQGLLLAMFFDDGAWYQVLSRSSGGARMVEIDRAPVPRRSGQHIPGIVLERHASKAACRAFRKVLDWRRSWPAPNLIEQFSLTFERCMRDVDREQGRCRVQLDMGRLRAEGRSRPWCEVGLTVDSSEGLEDLLALARRLVRDHGMCMGTVDLAWHGLNLIRPVEHTGAALEDAVGWDPDGDSDQQLRVMVAICLDHILPNAGALAASQCGPEQVHQLRVGIRRLRTVLREIGSVSDGIDPAWEVTLAEAFHGLGAQRDHDLIAELRPQMRDAGAPESMTCPGTTPSAVTACSIVRKPEFQATLLDLLTFSLRRNATPSSHGRSLRKLLERRLERLHRKVLSDGNRFESLPDDLKHRVRKRLKRLRYLSEFARSLFKHSKVDGYLEALAPAQGALGVYNDRVVALDMWRRHVQTDQQAWFAVGWLSAERHQVTKDCRRALRKVAKTARFWSRG